MPVKKVYTLSNSIVLCLFLSKQMAFLFTKSTKSRLQSLSLCVVSDFHAVWREALSPLSLGGLINSY